MMSLVTLALLLTPVASLKVDSADNVRPVTKVVNLLKEMQAQIEKEGAEDAALQDKMACWCETNLKEKTKAVEIADGRIDDLNAAVPMYAAKAAELDVQIKALKKEVVEKSSALEEATELRAKEQSEFRTNEKDMISSLSAMKGAVRTLSKVQGDAALPQESLAQVQHMMAHMPAAHQALIQKALSSTHHRVLLSLLQHPASMLQQNSKNLKGKTTIPMQGKGTQSNVIFGILKQMKEEFETNIESSQKEEQEAVSQFEALKSAKTREVAAANDLIETKTVEMADAKNKNAVSKEDLEDTRVALAADKKFLSDLKLTCQQADKDFANRQKVRNEELTAVSETIAILADDDSKDQFNKSMGFLQTSMRSSKRDRAAEVLSKAAKKLQKPKLQALAMRMKLSGFEEVKEEIDKVIAALKEEQKTEVEQKDYCIKEFNENDKQTAAGMDAKEDLEHKIAQLTTTMEELTDAIAELNGEIADTKTEMMKASQNREAANHEFQVTVNDQRATQAILQKAVDKLKSFYDKKAAALLQNDQEPGAPVPPPPQTGTYKKSGGATGVLTMIETLIEESKELEKEAMAAETEAQTTYESFMKDSTAANDAASRDVTNKSEELAKADAAKVQATSDLKSTVDNLLTLAEYGQELHKQCDFLVKNFDLRQSSRTQEMEALAQAKAIFSGAF